MFKYLIDEIKVAQRQGVIKDEAVNKLLKMLENWSKTEKERRLAIN